MASPQLALPDRLERGGPEEGEPHLFLKVRLKRRGDATALCELLGKRNRFPIEEFKEAINILLSPAPLLGGHRLKSIAQLSGEPIHLGAVVR